jgi:hypothetical protein
MSRRPGARSVGACTSGRAGWRWVRFCLSDPLRPARMGKTGAPDTFRAGSLGIAATRLVIGQRRFEIAQRLGLISRNPVVFTGGSGLRRRETLRLSRPGGERLRTVGSRRRRGGRRWGRAGSGSSSTFLVLERLIRPRQRRDAWRRSPRARDRGGAPRSGDHGGPKPNHRGLLMAHVDPTDDRVGSGVRAPGAAALGDRRWRGRRRRRARRSGRTSPAAWGSLSPTSPERARRHRDRQGPKRRQARLRPPMAGEHVDVRVVSCGRGRGRHGSEVPLGSRLCTTVRGRVHCSNR